MTGAGATPRPPGPRAGRLVLAALLAALGGCGDGTPEGFVVEPTAVDFGTVVQGDDERREIRLVNGSDRSVMVMDARPNCICFHLGTFQRLLQPGESTTIPITFDTRSLMAEGPIEGKQLDLMTNDVAEPRRHIPLRGSIRLLRRITPRLVELGDVSPGAPAEHRITVRPDPGVELEVLGVDMQPRGLFETEVLPADGGADILVRLREGARGEGRLSAALEIRTRVTGGGLGAPRPFVDAVRFVGRWTEE